MQEPLAFQPPRWVALLVLLLALLGSLTLAAGLVQDSPRTWAHLLLVSNYLIGVATGSLVLVALFDVTGARWSIPLRRLPEALALGLPIAGLGLVAVLLFRPSLYAWTADALPAGEPVSALRSVWLVRPFFLLRAVVYLAIWLTFAILIFRNSRLQEQTGDPAFARSNVRLSAGFLVAFGITCWLSGSDWLMSLEPDWGSTMFAVYHFAGLFLSALAAVTLLVILFRCNRRWRAAVTRDHLHDLGTLLFGFSSFWMYTWFCQYLLIWYTNRPDEVSYFLRRSAGPWPGLLLADLVLNWGIPFLVLLFRDAKRSPMVLGTVALIVLAGRWVDLFLIIFPTQGEPATTPGGLEVGLAVGGAGLFALAVLRALGQAPVEPVQDPVPEGTEGNR
jgi:hypothetical protein